MDQGSCLTWAWSKMGEKALFMDDIKSAIFSCLKKLLRGCEESVEEAFCLVAPEKYFISALRFVSFSFLLLHPYKCWDYRGMPLCSARTHFSFTILGIFTLACVSLITVMLWALSHRFYHCPDISPKQIHGEVTYNYLNKKIQLFFFYLPTSHSCLWATHRLNLCFLTVDCFWQLGNDCTSRSITTFRGLKGLMV